MIMVDKLNKIQIFKQLGPALQNLNDMRLDLF